MIASKIQLISPFSHARIPTAASPATIPGTEYTRRRLLISFDEYCASTFSEGSFQPTFFSPHRCNRQHITNAANTASRGQSFRPVNHARNPNAASPMTKADTNINNRPFSFPNSFGALFSIVPSDNRMVSGVPNAECAFGFESTPSPSNAPRRAVIPFRLRPPPESEP